MRVLKVGLMFRFLNDSLIAVIIILYYFRLIIDFCCLFGTIYSCAYFLIFSIFGIFLWCLFAYLLHRFLLLTWFLDRRLLTLWRFWLILFLCLRFIVLLWLRILGIWLFMFNCSCLFSIHFINLLCFCDLNILFESL